MADKKYKKIAVGGTFDRFHEGHLKLLSKAFQLSETVLIGVTSDDFAKSKGVVEPCHKRMSNLVWELEKFSGYYKVSRLDDSCGQAIEEDDIEALVVSEETEPAAQMINDIRKKKGMGPMDIIIIDMVLADDGKPISSTRIREGEIDVVGTILKD